MPCSVLRHEFNHTHGSLESVSGVRSSDCEDAQGEGTDGETVGKMRKAVREGAPCVVQLLNYKKNGVRPEALALSCWCGFKDASLVPEMPHTNKGTWCSGKDSTA